MPPVPAADEDKAEPAAEVDGDDGEGTTGRGTSSRAAALRMSPKGEGLSRLMPVTEAAVTNASHLSWYAVERSAFSAGLS